MSCCFDASRAYRQMVHGTSIHAPFGTMGVATKSRGDGINVLIPGDSTSVSFPAPSNGAGYFLFLQKVAKDIASARACHLLLFDKSVRSGEKNRDGRVIPPPPRGAPASWEGGNHVDVRGDIAIDGDGTSQ